MSPTAKAVLFIVVVFLVGYALGWLIGANRIIIQ